MFIKVVCPSCKAMLQAVERALGEQVDCPVCEILIRVSATESATSHAPQVPEGV